jgi:tape measure domain-containing protein
MANETIRARIEVLLKGLDQVDSLKNAVRQLQTTAAPASADLQKLKNAAMQLGGASSRTESDLRKSINALKDVRAQLSLTDREYRKLTGTINKYQAQLDKATGAQQQQGGRGTRFAQTAGAVAASGVFGGPEGLIGAGIGGILGGPGGALAGGAIGGQVGMFRQQIGVLTTYAADISKLEIALKGVTKTQEEYQRALAASASVTRDFNVPQLEATKGMTQLSAAVIGAGGKVADAEVVFRNVTAAIKASGGTSEDVQGSLTALGQIFSKGKVSAEELQGQLGERLPGAVTMFAKATGRTLPQLQKDLEQGVVGLADLMKFVVSDQGLGQFEQRAKDISDSSAEAGARLTATWNDTKRAIGEALLPLGAEIQNSLVTALKSATPALVELAKGFAGLIEAVASNAGVIASIAKLALTFTGAGLAMKAFGALLGPVQAGLGLLSIAFGKTTAQAVVAQNRLAAFGTTVRTLARSLAAPILLTVGIIGAEIVWGWLSKIKEARDRLKSATSDIRGEAWVKSIGGAALDTERLQDQVSAAGKAYQLAADKLKAYNAELKSTPFKPRQEFLRQQIAAEEAVLKLAESRYKAGIDELSKRKGDKAQGLTDFSLAGGGKGDLDKRALDKARAEAERLAAEQQRLNEAAAKAEIQLAQTVFNNQIELIKKRWDYEEERLQRQRDLQAGALEGERAETRRAANEFLARIESIRRSVREATLGVVVAEQNAAFGARMEAVTGQGLSGGGVPLSSTGIVARTGNTGQSTGAHLDLRWGDGRPITKADADKYFLVNGRAPSSFGVTSPYGPRSLFGRSFHGGIDFGTPAGSAITLKGGATFGRNLGNTGAGGYAIEVMTPEGTMRALHLMANSAIKTSPAGVAAQTRRNVAAAGKAGSSSAEATQAANLLSLTADQAKFLLSNEAQKYAQDRTQGLRNEAKALEDNNALMLKRMQLEQSGMRPELLDAQLKIAEIEQRRLERTLELKQLIREAEGDDNTVALDGYQKELDLVNSTLDRQIAAYNALAQAQIAPGVALANYIGQLKLQLDQLTNVENVLITIGQTVETQISSAMSSAVTSVVTGSGSIKQALSDMFANIGQSFIKMATDIIAKQLVIIALNSIAKIFGGGGFGFSGAGPVSGASVFGGGQAGFNPAAFTGGFSFAKGGVMTSRGPIPMKRYASGGIANSPQMALFGEGSKPEAYVPLPDGRSIPVSLKGQDKMNEIMGRSPVAQQAPTLNMTFQTTNIGGVEYVSRDQLEAAMAETRRAASRDGAKRGMSMTLDRLQQSPTTRRQVGLR